MPDAFALANAFVRIRPDATGFRAEADAKLHAALAGISPSVKIGADTTAAKMITGDLRAYLNALVRRNFDLRIGLDDKGLLAQLTRDYALMQRLDRRIDIPMTLTGATKIQAQLLALDASMDRAKAKIDAGTGAARGFYGIWGLLTNRTKIPLFGGQSFGWIPKILVGVGALHLIVDVLAEMLAVLIPAALALGAFALAAADSFRAVFHQLQNMHTVMDATGQTMKPFTSNLEKMHDAVRPAVFALLGDAMTIVNAKTGEFNKLALGTAQIMQEFGARIAVAIKGAGISEFLRNAVTDLHGVMDIFGNLFGVLGNFLHVMPGIAQGLLVIVDSFTHFAEVVTGGPLIGGLAKIALGFHGVAIYAGLFGTLAGKVITPLLSGMGGLAIKASEGIAKFGKAGLYASSALGVFGNTAKVASKLPWGWIAVAAIGIGFLAFKMFTARDATQKWIDSLDALMLRQNAVAGFLTLQEQQAQVSTKLSAATAVLTRNSRLYAQALVQVHGQGGIIAQQAQHQVNAVNELTAAQKTQIAQSTLYINRLAGLGRAFGGVGEAQGLLIASGVTMADMLKAGQHGWELLLQRVEATVQGYQLMGQTGGALGADMNAMNIVINDQYTAMQKLNSTWDTLMGVVSGGETGFITFEQDIISVNKALAGTGGVTRNVTATFDSVKAASKQSGASMNGLNAASLQLRQTWQTAFTGAQSLIDGLRTMGSIRAGGFPSVTLAIKDMLKQLLNVGAQGKESRNELVSLAQEVNPNIHNFKELTTWLGNTQGAGKNLDKLVTKMGGSIKDLANDAQSLSTTLKNDVIKQFDATKLSAIGAGKDIKTMAEDIVSNSSASKRHHDEDKLYSDFRRAGLNAQDAARLITTMTGDIYKVPTHRNILFTETGIGKFKILQITPGTKLGLPGGTAGGLNVARGGFIPGSGNRDTVPAMLTPGEVVVPKWMVRSGIVDHLRGMIPGFAAGGQVGAWPWPHRGLGPVQLGQATRNFDARFVTDLTNTMKSSMTAAMKTAVRHAIQSMAVANVGSGVARWRGTVLRALGMLGLPFGDAGVVLSQMATESGGNPNAINLWDSNAAAGTPSKGLMQTIGPTFSAYHVPGTSWNIYDPLANIAAAINYAIHRYGNPGFLSVLGHGHGYAAGGMVKEFDKGGWLMPGMTMAVNRTGRPERVSAHREPIVIKFQSSGTHDFDRFMMNWLQRTVRNQGGGDVQLTFGTG